MLKIIDNAINDSLLISIQEKIASRDMPWYLIENSAYANNKELIKNNPLNYSFFHLILDKERNNSPTSFLYETINSMGLILKDLFE